VPANYLPVVKTCPGDKIKEEKMKRLSSEAESKLLLKGEVKNEGSSEKSKLDCKLEMLLNLSEQQHIQSQMKKRELKEARKRGLSKRTPDSKQKDNWTNEEHKRFIDAIREHGRDWDTISEAVGTKNLL